MDDKMKNKIAELKEQLAEERELRKSLQRELNDTRKLLGKARALADKMSGACSALIEAVEEEGTGKKPISKDDSDKMPRGGKKPSKKDGGKKPSKKDGDKKPSKGDSKKDGGKKPSKVVKLTSKDDDADEDEAPKTKKVKGDKKVSKKDKTDKPSKKDDGKKSSKDGKKGDSKKDALKVKGKAPKKANKHEVDLDDDYED